MRVDGAPPWRWGPGANGGMGAAVAARLARVADNVAAGTRGAAGPAELPAAPPPRAGSPGTARVPRKDVGDGARVASAISSVLAETGGRVDVTVVTAEYGAILATEGGVGDRLFLPVPRDLFWRPAPGQGGAAGNALTPVGAPPRQLQCGRAGGLHFLCALRGVQLCDGGAL